MDSAWWVIATHISSLIHISNFYLYFVIEFGRALIYPTKLCLANINNIITVKIQDKVLLLKTQNIYAVYLPQNFQINSLAQMPGVEPGFHGFLKGSMVGDTHTLSRSHDRKGPTSPPLPMSNHWMNYAASLHFQINPIKIYLLSLLYEVQLQQALNNKGSSLLLK